MAGNYRPSRAHHWVAVTGKDNVTIGAENIAAGKTFGPEDIAGPVTSK